MIALPKGVHATTKPSKKGERTYYYFAPGRGTAAAAGRVRLPDDPGSFEFWQRYSELTGTVNPMNPAPSAGSVAALIAAYQASPEFGKRKPRTKAEYLRHMETIASIWGARQVRSLQPKHILAFRDSFAETPTKADHLVSMLSTLCTFGKFRGFSEINPCQGLPDLADTDGYPPWAWADIEYARDHLPPRLWWAAAVALYTGQRQSDCLNMNRNAIVGGYIMVRQAKTGKELSIPIHRELRSILDAIPKVSVRILTNSRGQPWASGFKAVWQTAMNGPAFVGFRERHLVFHGLRKSAVCMLLEAGCTDAEVSAITGQSRQMVEHYSIMVNQRKLARGAILKWEQNMP